MEKIYTKIMQIPNIATDRFGRMKTSWLLACLQEVAGEHSELLGASNGEYNGRNLFWAVTRHKVEITRLPEAKENITLQTWPCPTTRVAYPRATVAYDKQGNELFRAMSLWVLMDADSRAMILPGKSGVLVEGALRGNELSVPRAILPAVLQKQQTRTVRYTQLDRNGHMNNTRYLDLLCDHIPDFRSRMVTSIGIKFKAEAPLGETIKLYRAKVGDTYYFRTIRSDGQINIEAEIETKIIE